VKSARLAQSWTTQCLRVVSHVDIPFDGMPTTFTSNNIDLIGGRWLLVCQSKRRIVLYDTNADAKTRVPQILWEHEEHIGSWDKYSMVSEAGQLVVYVILSEEHNPLARQWYVCIHHAVIGRHFLFSNPIGSL
jgi:hypothetical protein